MRAATGLAALTLIAGCQQPAEPTSPVPPTAVSTAASPAQDNSAVALLAQPDLAKDFDAFPRFAGDTAEMRRANADFARMDTDGRKALTDCLSQGGQYADWSRSISVTMAGKRFVGLGLNDSYFCGGNHPNVALVMLTYDTRTGRQIDWSRFLPKAYIEPLAHADNGLIDAATTRSPPLIAWYREAVRADPDTPPGWLEQCDSYFGADAIDQPLMIWLDAEHEGLGLDLSDLPSVAMACGFPVVMPISELRRIGAAPELITAIEAAHRARSWRESVGDAAPPLR